MFFGMTIMLILAMFFSLIEVVHLLAVKGNSGMAADAAVESVFADYNRPLFKDYGILAIDGAYGESALRLPIIESRGLEYMGANTCGVAGRANYISLAADDCRILKYSLLTDDGGKAFLKQAAEYEKLHAMTDLIRLPDDAQGKLKEDYGTESKVDGLIDAGKNALENPGAVDDVSVESSTEPASPPRENPIETVAEWKRTGLLAQVIPPDQTVSSSAMAGGDRLSRRHLNTGNQSGGASLGAADALLYQAYFREHFACYTAGKKRQGMQYELEYMVGGKDSDEANLKAVVARLLAAREAENLVAISTDSAKLSEAEAIAIALCASIASPELANAVKWALVAAWAYVESVLDVRQLLSGGKVSLVKSSAEWTSGLANIAECLDTSVKAKNCTGGMDYRQYLTVMLTVMSQKKLAYRAMDVVENELRSMKDYGNVKLDNFIVGAEFSCEFTAVPAFLALVVVPGGPGVYPFRQKRQMSYLVQ